MNDDAPERPAAWHVVCLCAAWCGVCRDWLPVLRQAAAAHPQWQVAWIDVEDHDEAMGDVDVETFPTMLVARGDEPLFLGPIPPSAVQLERLVERLQASGGAVPGEARDLLQRLKPVLDAGRV
ncbi:MAG: thioredoxin family protein [Burkholderiales bacterium]|nr:thioredoxin family protein [Burkholderiales bacterium]